MIFFIISILSTNGVIILWIEECKFEASNDSTNGYDGNWIILETHRNDNALNAKAATHTWKLQQHILQIINHLVNLEYFNMDQIQINIII